MGRGTDAALRVPPAGPVSGRLQRRARRDVPLSRRRAGSAHHEARVSGAIGPAARSTLRWPVGSAAERQSHPAGARTHCLSLARAEPGLASGEYTSGGRAARRATAGRDSGRRRADPGGPGVVARAGARVEQRPNRNPEGQVANRGLAGTARGGRPVPRGPAKRAQVVPDRRFPRPPARAVGEGSRRPAGPCGVVQARARRAITQPGGGSPVFGAGAYQPGGAESGARRALLRSAST